MKTCYIVGAGDFFGARFAPAPGDYIIAADAGYRYLTRLGVSPDLIVGDFDSLGETPVHPNVTVCPVEKDDTDTLVAVRRALDMGARRLMLFGGTGGRLDHTLANIQTLAFAATRGAEAFLFGDGCAMTALTGGRLHFSGYTGGLSVFCLGDRAAGVEERGVKYPLHEAELTCDYPLGVSNEFAGDQAEIAVRDGMLILYWQGNEDRPLPAREVCP